MEIGSVLSEAWGLYKRFLWQFFLTAFVVFRSSTCSRLSPTRLRVTASLRASSGA